MENKLSEERIQDKKQKKNKRKQNSLLGVKYFFYQMVSMISILIINDYVNVISAY